MNSTFKHIFFIVAILCFSCDKDDSPEECTSRTPDATLVDIRSSVIIPNYTSAETEVYNLSGVIDLFISNPTVEQLSNVRVALKNAWVAWQAASPFEFGPANDTSLRANVNTFPADSNFIEQSIANGELEPLATNSKGFPALDVLLNNSNISNDQLIELFISDANADNRKLYVDGVVDDIAARITNVRQNWEDNYGDDFVVNTGFATGSSMSLFINAYIQDWEQVKRDRIALPLGLLTFEMALPERVECYYGGYSQELALAHVRSHYDIYLSQDHLGIQELVQGVTNFTGENGETLDETIIEQFELVIEKLTEVPDPLSETVTVDFDVVNEAYLALQDMVVLLKTDLTSGLGISINFADNDGD